MSLWWVPPRKTAKPITDYRVQISADGGRTWKKASDPVSAEPSATVSGLRNGRGYRFRIATVAGNVSAYSPASKVVTPKPVDCGHLAPRANLSGCEVTDMTVVDLSGANLQGSTLGSGEFGGLAVTRFAGANLANARIYGDLRSVDLRGANLKTVIFATYPSAHIDDSNLKGISARNTDLGASWNRTDISDADLTGASFGTHVRFGGVRDVRFNRSLLSGCDFGATLVNVDFTNADLTNCNFTRAEASQVRFTRASLAGTDFSGPYSRINGLDLQDADLSRAIFTEFGNSGHMTGRPTALPPSWQLRNGFLVGPTVRLWGNASGANFRGVDFTNAQLGAGFEGPLNLTGADLSRSNLTGTDMTYSILYRARAHGITGDPTLPAGWALVDGHFVQIA